MATIPQIERVLDLLTITPESHIESLAAPMKSHTRSMKSVTRSKNVVAMGIGEKVSNKKGTGKLALIFYVQKKIPLNKLRADMAIPATVPESLSGSTAIPVDVVVIGKIKLETNVTRSTLQPGNSIGHVDVSAGTFGAVVTDGKSNYILSNSHVLANSGLGKKGDNILYPGPADGGVSPADIIAKLHAFKPFVVGGKYENTVDCAIAKPVPDKAGSINAAIKGIGVPKGTIKAVRGMKLVKVGRTTGKTEGEVKDIHFRFIVDYPGVGEVGFKNQVFCTRYSKPGDSGSLVIDKASGKAMGLHFAGADGGSIFNPIDEVLSALKIKLVTKQPSVAEAAKKAKSKPKRVVKVKKK